jgi:hypothetical protein
MHFSVLVVREKKHLSKWLQSCIIHHYAMGIQFNQYSIENHTKDYAKSSLYQVRENSSLEFFFMVCFMVKMA